MNLAMTRDLPADVMSTAYEPDDDLIKLLAEIGLSAAVRGSGETAAPIFAALALFRPDNPLAAVGQALGDIAEGRLEDAIGGLRRAGATHETCPDELRAVLLIALCLAGQRIDAALLCRKLLSDGDGPSRQIARRLKPVIDAGLPSGGAGAG